MEAVMGFITEYTLFDLFAFITLLVVVVRSMERFVSWVGKKLRAYYKHRKGIEEKDVSLSEGLKKINSLSARVDTIEKQHKESAEHECEIMKKLDKLSEMLVGIEEKCTKLEQNIESNKQKSDEVDRDLLRDRILGGMRFFNQNKDNDGRVHISRSDHENLSHLFERYFERNGNGTVKQKYKNEFLQFIIDD